MRAVPRLDQSAIRRRKDLGKVAYPGPEGRIR